MKIILYSLFTVTSVLILVKSSAQGCSDAGFCTIGNLGHPIKDTDSPKRQKISLLLGNGIGDENVYVFTPGIQYDNAINKHWSMQGKITGNYADGNLGHAIGLGDLFISSTYRLRQKNNWETAILLGTKFFLNKGDIHSGNKPLPMQYQSSLGTVDLLAGITIANNKWSFSTAIQQPLTGINRNTFLPAYWKNGEADKYPPTNSFNRKGDVLIKAGYNLITKNKIDVFIGLLGICHLGRDTYIDGNISNNPITLNGSEGVTLNGTGVIHYKVSDEFSIGLSAGVPFLVRDIRPDGLTRKFILSPELIVNF